MIDKLISFETAKLAREKGFDWNTKLILQYSDKEGFEFEEIVNFPKYHPNGCISCKLPTQSLLQKWLREKHNLLITTGINREKVQRRYIFYIDGLKDHELIEESLKPFDTYEEALEFGLQEALKLVNYVE